MLETVINAFGWYGTAAIVAAYALVSFSVIEPTSIAYQLLNGSGAFGIVAVSLFKRTYQPAVLNIIWMIIALVAILQIMF